MGQAYSVEESTLTWLESLGYDAYIRPPENRPAAFVTVERTGGGVVDMVDKPIVAIQSWAQTPAAAEETANAIRLAALLGPLPVGVHSMRVNSGPYKFFDEESKTPRYQIAFDVACQIVK